MLGKLKEAISHVHFNSKEGICKLSHFCVNCLERESKAGGEMVRINEPYLSITKQRCKLSPKRMNVACKSMHQSYVMLFFICGFGNGRILAFQCEDCPWARKQICIWAVLQKWEMDAEWVKALPFQIKPPTKFLQVNRAASQTYV